MSKRDLVAMSGVSLLAITAAVLASLQLPHMAIALVGILVGGVGGLVILAGAAARSREKRLATQGQRALTAIRRNRAAISDIERSIDSLRFSQSVVTQALSSTKNLAVSTAEAVQSNQQQLEQLTQATSRFVEELSSALGDQSEPTTHLAGRAVDQHGASRA